MSERGLSVDHTTIYRWVQRYAPILEKRCRAKLKQTNDSWRVDETYIRVKGTWMYLYKGCRFGRDHPRIHAQPYKGRNCSQALLP